MWRQVTIVVLVATAAASTGYSAPTTQADGQLAPLEVAYFFSPNCLKCRQVSELLDDLEATYGGRIRVVRYDILTNDGMKLLGAYEDRYGSDKSESPAVFVGRRCLAGLDPIAGNLPAVLEEELAHHDGLGTPPPAEVDGGQNRVLDDFKGFRATAVTLAGLIDGINPCAFTTIVFLLSMLAFLGKGRRELVVVGASFTFAVFGTYLLLGIGVLVTIKAFAVNQGISLALTYVMAGLTFILAGWSFLDAIRIARTGKVPSGALGMPDSIRQRVHQVIRTGLKTPSLMAGSLAVGCLVALLESICTGQVYLPTILYVFRNTDRRAEALGYLLLYNLAFIAPLATLVAMSYWGVRSQRLGDFMRRHLAATKALLGALFVALGALLLATV